MANSLMNKINLSFYISSYWNN